MKEWLRKLTGYPKTAYGSGRVSLTERSPWKQAMQSIKAGTPIPKKVEEFSDWKKWPVGLSSHQRIKIMGMRRK